MEFVYCGNKKRKKERQACTLRWGHDTWNFCSLLGLIDGRTGDCPYDHFSCG